MNKCLVLVKNSFINDARVKRTCETIQKNNFKVTVIAEKSSKGTPVIQSNGYRIYRVPVFSALYSKRRINKLVNTNQKPKTNIKSKIINLIKNNKLRQFIVSELNSLLYNSQTIMLGIIIKPDLIIANDLETLTAGIIINKLVRSKIIYDSHEIWLEGKTFASSSKLKQLYWIFTEKSFISSVDQVIVTTSYRARFLESKYNIRKAKVIRNCPKAQHFKKTNILHREFNIPNSKKIVLYQGLIDKARGIFTMVDVVSEIENTVLIFMGRGDDRTSLNEYIKKNQLANKIFIKEEVDNSILLKYTSDADVGLQLLYNTGINHYSTISNKVFEYMMAEIAILASDFPEIRNLIGSEKVGLVANPEDKKEIKQKLLELLKKDKLKDIQESYKRIDKKYSWENEKEKLLEILEKLKV